MYAISTAYKEEQEQDLRERSYIWVYLGLINEEAQNAASISSDLADFGRTDIFGSSLFEAYYATAEENFSKADGTLYFMPEDSSLYGALNQGAVSYDLLGSISFVFTSKIDKISGLTIDFGEIYPTEFTVQNGEEILTYTNDSSGIYIVDHAFEGVESLIITPVSMVGGQQRMRIHAITFGVGFVFDNSSILSTKRTNDVSHLSTELPTKTFEFSIDNLDQEWTVDNPASHSNLLKETQIVQVVYGRDLGDTIYKIPSGYMALASWESTHMEAKFKAVGFLDYSTTTYYKGACYSNGITLYDLAVDVLEDMGVKQYKIDTWLKYLTVKNPLPIDLHKNCLQMIANAGQCSLYEDTAGVITIKATIALPDYTITAENYEAFSNLDSLTDSSQTFNYAFAEADYSVTDGSLYFIDDIITEHNTGLVSYLYPTDNEMSVTVELMAMWTWTGIMFKFGVVYPTTITIAEYYDGSLKATNNFTVTGSSFFLDHEFYEVDKIVVTFSGVADNTRIHLNKMLMGNVLDYTIKEHEMMQLPTAIQTERVRNIYIKYYDFIKSTKSITATANATVGDNLITLDEPCYGYVVTYKDTSATGTIEIVESGAYYVIFSSTINANVDIKANKYEIAENTVSTSINETGQDITLENDLISDSELATRVLEWFAEYYGADVEYTLTYRGEPALECNDRIFTENRFVTDNQVLITHEELSTSTGMSMNNTIKARRLSYTE